MSRKNSIATGRRNGFVEFDAGHEMSIIIINTSSSSRRIRPSPFLLLGIINGRLFDESSKTWRRRRGPEEKLLSINQMGIYLFFNTDSSSSYQVLSTSRPRLHPLPCHCSSFVHHRLSSRGIVV